MATPIILKIDVKKINKEWLFAGNKGTYLDAVVYENDRESQFGDTHVVKQNPPKEARDKGEKPVIIGNGRWMPQRGGQQQARPAQTRQQPQQQTQGDNPKVDDIPF
jgi:hypothetical protein